MNGQPKSPLEKQNALDLEKRVRFGKWTIGGAAALMLADLLLGGSITTLTAAGIGLKGFIEFTAAALGGAGGIATSTAFLDPILNRILPEKKAENS